MCFYVGRVFWFWVMLSLCLDKLSATHRTISSQNQKRPPKILVNRYDKQSNVSSLGGNWCSDMVCNFWTKILIEKALQASIEKMALIVNSTSKISEKNWFFKIDQGGKFADSRKTVLWSERFYNQRLSFDSLKILLDARLA